MNLFLLVYGYFHVRQASIAGIGFFLVNPRLFYMALGEGENLGLIATCSYVLTSTRSLPLLPKIGKYSPSVTSIPKQLISMRAFTCLVQSEDALLHLADG